MSAKVFVSGANGKTGRAVISALIAQGAQVRGLVRQPNHVERLEIIGVEGHVGDLEDAASLKAGAKGCDVVLHIGPPMYAKEVETTEAMLEAARAGGASRFIYYSVMHPLRQEVEHHRLKLLAEAHVVESGLPYSIVQPIRYMQHLEPIWTQVKEEGVHAMAFNTKVRFNVVDLADLAEATATVALDDAHAYASYELAGPEALSQDDMAAILTEELERPIEAVHLPLDQLRANAEAKGVPAARIERMVTMNDHYDRYGFLGNPNVLSWILGRAPTTYRAYVQRLIRPR